MLNWSNFIYFFDKTPDLQNMGKATEVLYLDFTEAFDGVQKQFHNAQRGNTACISDVWSASHKRDAFSQSNVSIH